MEEVQEYVCVWGGQRYESPQIWLWMGARMVPESRGANDPPDHYLALESRGLRALVLWPTFPATMCICAEQGCWMTLRSDKLPQKH